MKTSVNMVRKLDIFDVVQRTKDGMFDANVLLRQWNEANNSELKIINFFNGEKVKEFVQALAEDLKLEVPDYQVSKKTYLPDNQIVSIIKGRTQKNGARTPDQVWMHPLLFIDFAMWLNPSFKVKVLKFVYDNLIAFRHSCGDNYIGLTASVSKFPDVDYPRLAQALNYVVFGKHYGNIRNDATESQLSELRSLEEKLSYAVDNDFITNFEELIKTLRRNWAEKWSKF